ncbi:hypothetical protein QZH41_010928, partial [Actinostola sp. cb2023]
LTKANKGVLRVSSNSSVIHKVGKDNDLNSIKALLRSHSANDITCVPSYGLYWLRKGSKEPVALNTDDDLTSCKQEYLSKTGRQLASIRLACRFIENRVSQTSSTTTLPSPTSTSKPSNKRKLSFHSSDTCNSEEDHEDTQDKRLVEAIDLVDKLSEKKGKDSKNELWNQCHANLLRDLEKKRDTLEIQPSPFESVDRFDFRRKGIRCGRGT